MTVYASGTAKETKTGKDKFSATLPYHPNAGNFLSPVNSL
jgi:hypothetical protein